jgi:hypothetical protein
MPASIYNKDVETLKGHAPFGSGECVALPQAVTDVGHTSKWYPGIRVLDLAYLNPGTVIANFVFQGRRGRFPNRHGYHAALFMGFGPRSQANGEITCIYVMDKWTGRDDNRVNPRTIRTYSTDQAKRMHVKPSDNANEFYVVEK